MKLSKGSMTTRLTQRLSQHPEDAEENQVTAHAVNVRVSDEYYAMVDSGTNAIIVPLHPDMCGVTAECKVPSATVEGPIVQVLKYGQERRFPCRPAPVSHPHNPGVAHHYRMLDIHLSNQGWFE